MNASPMSKFFFLSKSRFFAFKAEKHISLTLVAVILEVVSVNWVEAEKVKQYQRYKPHYQSFEDSPGTFDKFYRYETANDEKLTKLLQRRPLAIFTVDNSD